MRTIAIILTLLGVLFYQIAGADSAKQQYTDPDKSIVLGKDNPEFTIKLASNPTTGYSWMIKGYKMGLVTVVGHKFQPPISQLVGAGGVDVWTFKLAPEAFNAPHVLKIKMLYARPWDVSDNNKEQEFTVVTH